MSMQLFVCGILCCFLILPQLFNVEMLVGFGMRSPDTR